jgi:hypothetical protein
MLTIHQRERHVLIALTETFVSLGCSCVDQDIRFLLFQRTDLSRLNGDSLEINQ